MADLTNESGESTVERASGGSKTGFLAKTPEQQFAARRLKFILESKQRGSEPMPNDGHVIPQTSTKEQR